MICSVLKVNGILGIKKWGNELEILFIFFIVCIFIWKVIVIIVIIIIVISGDGIVVVNFGSI